MGAVFKMNGERPLRKEGALSSKFPLADWRPPSELVQTQLGKPLV